jgi:hypothetical protein
VAAVLASLLWAAAAPAAENKRATPNTDWPQWLGPGRNGISTETGWSPGRPAKLWSKTIGIGFSNVAVRGGKLYTMGSQDGKDHVYCLDAATGRPLWIMSYPAPPHADKHYGPRCTPAVDDKHVYTISLDGQMTCWDAGSGRVVWSQQLQQSLGVKPAKWGFSTSVLLQDDHLLIDVGAVVALDKRTGRPLWKTPNYGAAYSSPVAFELDGRKCVATFSGSGLTVVTAGGGKLLYRYPWRTAWGVNAATPVIFGNDVFISSGYKTGCARVRLGDGKATTVWRNRNMSNHCNNSLLWKGHLYGFNGNVGGRGKLTCLDFQSGQTKWTDDSLGTGGLRIADGKLIILGEYGTLVIAEATPAEFKPLSRTDVLKPTCWTAPVLSGGRIYCRNFDKRRKTSDLVCMDVRGR